MPNAEFVDKKYMTEVREWLVAHAAMRRQVIGLASDAQNASKRAIFALHRDDVATADTLLAGAESRFVEIRAKIAAHEELVSEGSYRAALEEYAEAALYREFVRSGRVGKILLEDVDQDIFLGGLADLTGELQRRQVYLATEGKLDEVKNLKEAIQMIIEELMAMDLEGYLRTKCDQAKNSLRRAEDVLYEMTIRRS